MTAADLTRARALLGMSTGELAAEIGLTEPVVRAWEEGSLRIPREYAMQIVWRAAVAERQAALASSGLPECTWVARWMDAAPTQGGQAQRDVLHHRAGDDRAIAVLDGGSHREVGVRHVRVLPGVCDTRMSQSMATSDRVGRPDCCTAQRRSEFADLSSRTPST